MISNFANIVISELSEGAHKIPIFALSDSLKIKKFQSHTTIMQLPWLVSEINLLIIIKLRHSFPIFFVLPWHLECYQQ